MRKKISEIAEIQIGYQARSRKGSFLCGSSRLVQMRDLDDDGQLDTKGMLSLDLEIPDRYRIKPGDLLFQARGSRHRAFVMDPIPSDSLASNHFYIIRLFSEAVLPAYLAWWVNQPPAQAQLMSQAQRTTMTLIPREAFESLEIELPLIAVQKSIVELARLTRCERQLAMRLQDKRDALISAQCLSAATESSTAQEE